MAAGPFFFAVMPFAIYMNTSQFAGGHLVLIVVSPNGSLASPSRTNIFLNQWIDLLKKIPLDDHYQFEIISTITILTCYSEKYSFIYI